MMSWMNIPCASQFLWSRFIRFRMLDELNRDMDRTESKMDNVLKKLAKVTHMSDGEDA